MNYLSQLILFNLISNYDSLGFKLSESGCKLKVKADIPKKSEPLLFLRKDDALVFAMPQKLPSFDAITLQFNEELYVSCPGTDNYVEVSKNITTSAFCLEGDVLSVGSNDYASSQLECNRRVAPSLMITNETCAQGKGKIISLGYDVQNWHELVRVCHQMDNASTFYSEHVVHGSTLQSRLSNHDRPEFSRGDDRLYQGFNPNEAYNMSNQVAMLKAIVGSSEVDKYFNTSKQLFMARGHMAPNADFIFTPWQHSTFFYVNVAPQWQSINGGNWMNVEKAVRALAKHTSSDLNVATGTHGIITFPSSDGFEEELYLGPGKRLPVPELYWKLVRSPSDNACMGIVSTNNPFLEKAPEPICKDVCEQYGWPQYKNELRKGYVYCCTFQDLKKTILDIPDFDCKSVLKYHGDSLSLEMDY